MMPSTLIQKCPQYVYSVFLFIRPSCLMPTLGQLFCLNLSGRRSGRGTEKRISAPRSTV